MELSRVAVSFFCRFSLFNCYSICFGTCFGILNGLFLAVPQENPVCSAAPSVGTVVPPAGPISVRPVNKGTQGIQTGKSYKPTQRRKYDCRFFGADLVKYIRFY